MSSRRTMALETIEEIIEGCEKSGTHLEPLLLKAKRVIDLLELTDEDHVWIHLELEGYMKIEDIEAREKYKQFLTPHYRQIELAAAPNMPLFSDIRDAINQEQIRRAANPTPVWFEIRFPIGQLEVIEKTTLTKHIKIKYDQ